MATITITIDETAGLDSAYLFPGSLSTYNFGAGTANPHPNPSPTGSLNWNLFPNTPAIDYHLILTGSNILKNGVDLTGNVASMQWVRGPTFSTVQYAHATVDTG